MFADDEPAPRSGSQRQAELGIIPNLVDNNSHDNAGTDYAPFNDLGF